jgi:hypothetical protein
LKQLYDAQYYPKNIYVFVIDVFLSGISGIVLGFILSEQIQNELAIIGLSGLGGLFGVGALKALMKSNLEKLIHFPVNLDDIKVHNHPSHPNTGIQAVKDKPNENSSLSPPENSKENSDKPELQLILGNKESERKTVEDGKPHNKIKVVKSK